VGFSFGITVGSGLTPMRATGEKHTWTANAIRSVPVRSVPFPEVAGKEEGRT
jgi:hypothetical protein